MSPIYSIFPLKIQYLPYLPGCRNGCDIKKERKGRFNSGAADKGGMGGDKMKPAISDTGFGYITIEGLKIENDIVIRRSGMIKKRKKKLSKAVYGTSHTVSLEEAKHIYQDGAEQRDGIEHRK